MSNQLNIILEFKIDVMLATKVGKNLLFENLVPKNEQHALFQPVALVQYY